MGMLIFNSPRLDASFRRISQQVVWSCSAPLWPVWSSGSGPLSSPLKYIGRSRLGCKMTQRNEPVICSPGSGNSGAFNFSVFKALLNALHCGDKFMVQSLQKAPAPGGWQQWRTTNDLDHLNKLPPPPPHPMAVPHEIWLQLAQWFQRRYLNTHTHTYYNTTDR